MKPIEFSKDERTAIVSRIRDYFQTEMDQEIGNIPAEMLLRFFTEQIGPFYYNRGLADAQAVFASKLDDINDAIYALEQREALTR